MGEREGQDFVLIERLCPALYGPSVLKRSSCGGGCVIQRRPGDPLPAPISGPATPVSARPKVGKA
jgi:hypothetical protein